MKPVGHRSFSLSSFTSLSVRSKKEVDEKRGKSSTIPFKERLSKRVIKNIYVVLVSAYLKIQ